MTPRIVSFEVGNEGIKVVGGDVEAVRKPDRAEMTAHSVPEFNPLFDVRPHGVSPCAEKACGFGEIHGTLRQASNPSTRREARIDSRFVASTAQPDRSTPTNRTPAVGCGWQNTLPS
jgi:hypothetical protein